MNKFIKKAFTLIELLVVIAIIGILSGLIVVSMGGVTQKANIAKAQVFSNSLKNSLMLNLVSEWKFDQINIPEVNQTPDSWGNINTGTLVGATHLPVLKNESDCIRGKCLQFDGTEDYINCGSNISLNNTDKVTLEIWAKYIGNHNTADNHDQFFIVREGAYRGAYLFGFYDNHITLYGSHDGTVWTWIATNSKTYGSSGDTNWHHFVGTIDKDSGAKIYVDGVLAGKDSDTGTIKSEPSAILYIGKRNIQYFEGYLDEVRIYKDVVSISQIRNNFYSGLNSLLINGGITQEDYLSRLNNYASNN